MLVLSNIRFQNPQNTRIFADEISKKYELNSRNMGIQEILIMQAKEDGLEQGLEQGIEKGLKKGMEQRNIDIVLNAHKKGLSLDFIAEIVNLPVEMVQEIIEKYFKP